MIKAYHSSVVNETFSTDSLAGSIIMGGEPHHDLIRTGGKKVWGGWRGEEWKGRG